MAFQPKSYKKFVTASATAALVASAVSPIAAAAPFTDVNEDTRHSAAINALFSAEVVQGKADGSFGVSDQVKRGDAAVMIAKAAGFDLSASVSQFTDVNARQAGAVAALVEVGAINGFTETSFKPSVELTRGQMAKIIVDAFGLVGNDTEVTLTDIEGDRFEESIKVVFQNGVTGGFPDGTFRPDAKIKRGDFAFMLHTAMQVAGEVVTEVTVADVNGNVAAGVVQGTAMVEIKLAELVGATADTAVSIVVGEEEIALEYNASRDSFLNLSVSGYSVEELQAAIVKYDAVEPVEVVTGKTVAELDGNVASGVVQGTAMVEVKLANIAGATASSNVSLQIGDDVIALDYNESRSSFLNLSVSGYTVAELEAAVVVVQ